jgi:hypothetical protein
MLPSQVCSLLHHVKSEKLYKWPTLTFVILNITSSLIDFMFFKKLYQWRNSKINARLCFSAFISCTQLVRICRLLCWISIGYSQNNDLFYTSAIRNVGNTERIIFWRQFNGLVPLYRLPTTEHLPTSRKKKKKYRSFKRMLVKKYALITLQIMVIWGQDRLFVFEVTLWRVQEIFTNLRLTWHIRYTSPKKRDFLVINVVANNETYLG